MNKFYEAVPVSTKEIHANPTNLTFIEDDQRYVLRPLPVPEGFPSEADVEGEASLMLHGNIHPIQGGIENSPYEFGKRDGYEIGAKRMLSIATAIIASQQAEIAELKAENSDMILKIEASIHAETKTIIELRAEIERLSTALQNVCKMAEDAAKSTVPQEWNHCLAVEIPHEVQLVFTYLPEEEDKTEVTSCECDVPSQWDGTCKNCGKTILPF